MKSVLTLQSRESVAGFLSCVRLEEDGEVLLKVLRKDGEVLLLSVFSVGQPWSSHPERRVPNSHPQNTKASAWRLNSGLGLTGGLPCPFSRHRLPSFFQHHPKLASRDQERAPRRSTLKSVLVGLPWRSGG